MSGCCTLLLYKIKEGHLERSRMASDLLSGRRDLNPRPPAASSQSADLGDHVSALVTASVGAGLQRSLKAPGSKIVSQISPEGDRPTSEVRPSDEAR